MNKLGDFKATVLPHGWVVPKARKVKTETIVAKRGTHVTCPNCRQVIGRLAIDLYSGTMVAADVVDFVSRQKRRPGEQAECKNCGAAYMQFQTSVSKGYRTRIHTAVGWV